VNQRDLALRPEFDPNSRTGTPKAAAANTSSTTNAPPDLTEQPVHLHG